MIYLVSKQQRMFEAEIGSASINDVTDWLDKATEFCVDIETSWKYNGKYNYDFKGEWGKSEPNPNSEGLDPRLTKIVMVQVGNKDTAFVIDARDFGVDWLKKYLEDPKQLKVGQNLKFEYKHFKEQGIIMENMYDTMIAEKVLYTGWSMDWSLKGLISRYLDINDIDKDTRLEFGLIKDAPFTTKQILYGADDIVYPMQIKEMQEEELERKDVGITFKLEMKFLPVLADIEYNGMHFNKEVWQNTYEKNKVALDVAKTDLDSYVICNFKDSQFVDRQYDIFSEGFKCRVSWRSQQQVVNFFKHLGICPEEKGKPTLNAKVLRSFVPSVKEEKLRKLLNNYIRYKELSQATNTFGQKFFKYVHPITNRLYSNYNQILNTGRISSSSPNLQNIPAALGFRKAFDAPEGWKIVNADYSGQEQIILANKSEDPELQQFYTDGHSDMHSFIASKIYPELRDLPLDEIKKNHKDKRQIAKAAGFAINYGGTGYTIAKNLGISEKEGDAVYNAYFLAFPNLKKYFDKVQRISLNQGYILIDPITRRKNWFRKPENNRERAAIERNALNYPIQGEAGGITKLAPIYYREWIMENNLEDYILITNLVHDEINIEAKEEYAELAAKNLEICMQKAADVWCKTIKLSADAAIVDYWSH
jgi:DNA polymerase-1